MTYHMSQVALIGHIRRLHLTGRQLLVGWEVYGCGTYNVRGYPLAENPNDVDQIGCGVLNRAVDIYLNEWVYIRCPCLRFIRSQPTALPSQPFHMTQPNLR